MFPEIVINIIVINKVKYTEIDWIAYMQVGLEFKILFRGEFFLRGNNCCNAYCEVLHMLSLCR